MDPPPPVIDAAEVAGRADELRALVERHAVRPVRIVAVTKRFGADAVRAACAAGIVDVGENYAQELVAKAEQFAGAEPRWHFIGQLQRNKVRTLAPFVDLWQTVDSERLGREIARRVPGAAVLVQVNAAGAAGQGGVATAAVPALVDALQVLDLDVQGLLCLGAHGDTRRTATLFTAVRRLADDLGLAECSMGMSGDLVEALQAGSTMVRVGTALFGERPGP